MAVKVIVTLRKRLSPGTVRDMHQYLGTFASGSHNFVRTDTTTVLYLRDQADLPIVEGQFGPLIGKVDLVNEGVPQHPAG